MRHQRKMICALVLALSVSFLPTSLFGQAKHPQEIAKFMTDDVVAVAYIDLDNLDLNAALKVATQFGFVGMGEKSEIGEFVNDYAKHAKALKDAGGKRIYAILRSSDFQDQGTSFVIPLSGDSDDRKKATDAVLEFRDFLVGATISGASLPKDHPVNLFNCVDDKGNTILLSKTTEQLVRLQSERVDKPVAGTGGWKSLEGSSVGLYLFGDKNSRRVIGELMPTLDKPMEKITGRMIAEDLNWMTAGLNIGKTPGVQIVADTSNEETASIVEGAMANLIAMFTSDPGVKSMIPAEELSFVQEKLKPQRDGTQLVVSTNQLTKDMDRLAKVLAPNVEKVRKAAASTSRLNRLRQIVLAMHNYESAFTHFPTQSTHDEAGKSLLSWRVAILPFIGEQKLYDAFHHDEPWDSAHNRELISKMPEIYYDPGPGSSVRNKAGKTVFQVPCGDKLMFNGKKQTMFRDIHDGSSSTLLVTSVNPKFAVEWTTPADWKVDLDDPKAMLKRDGSNKVEAALGDGSVHRLSLDVDDKAWSHLLQHQDGNVTDLNRFK